MAIWVVMAAEAGARRRGARDVFDVLATSHLVVLEPAFRPPTWRSWPTLFAFVLDLDRWSRTLNGHSNYVLASEARDLVSKHGRKLDGAIRLPQLDWYKGEAYLPQFLVAMKACVKFLDLGV
jgi:hypothetical protein